MSVTVIVHITNEDAILGEVEEMPTTADQFITVRNPSRKDGKDLHYLEDEVTTMMIPWHRINFIEVMPSADELEEVITFVREQ
jgi:hypothetical protein